MMKFSVGQQGFPVFTTPAAVPGSPVTVVPIRIGVHEGGQLDWQDCSHDLSSEEKTIVHTS
ncbi:hypothetical protein [Massiliimalia timonensis]|uniref:hypothetical protein n=1 Tax=Massiliimalia timonensis TaxID=1987501 RepID=UPI001E3491FD|nr:hypothetical protein [Massiliimalia timonensis]